MPASHVHHHAHQPHAAVVVTHPTSYQAPVVLQPQQVHQHPNAPQSYAPVVVITDELPSYGQVVLQSQYAREHLHPHQPHGTAVVVTEHTPHNGQVVLQSQPAPQFQYAPHSHGFFNQQHVQHHAPVQSNPHQNSRHHTAHGHR